MDLILVKQVQNYGTTYGKGIYFSPNYETAKFYAGTDGIIISLNVDITPYYLNEIYHHHQKRK